MHWWTNWMSNLHISDGSYKRVKVERRTDDGTLEAAAAYRFDAGRDYGNAAADLGVTRDEVMAAVDAYRRGNGDTFPVAAVEGDTFTVSVRGRQQTADLAVPHTHANPLDALRVALTTPTAAPEPLLTWAGADRLCCVDADYHKAADRLTDARAADLAASATPRCRTHWRTHGGGLRLVYAAQDRFTARELAAVACLSIKEREPLATLELKTSTRHPLYPVGERTCGPVVWHTGDADVGVLGGWTGSKEMDQDEVDNWLAERGLQVGGRYPHDKCPLDPHTPAGRDPVSVRDGGVYCHACAGRGRTRGSRVPGWFPFRALLGSAAPGPLRACIDACAHWEHARFVVEECAGLDGEVGRAAYGAALVLRGHDRRCVNAAFAAGSNLIRLEHRWATLAGETYTGDIKPILARLPAALRLDGEKLVCDTERVARLEQPVDLSPLGYPHLTPVFGVRIYGHRLPLRDGGLIPVVMQTRDLARPDMEPLRPRYLPRDRRPYDEDAAWALLEEPFPGLNRSAVKLLVAARGCAEGAVGMPPMIFLSGPTGASKSSVIVLAAAICGDSNSSVVWTTNVERVRQAILKAKETGTFVTFNEILKESSKGGQGSRAAMDFVLNLTPDSSSHCMYVGAVPLGALPVFAWTDTAVPPELKQDAQLARRITHVEMSRQVDWERSLRDCGIHSIRSIRWADPRFATACDVVLSVVIDDFFSRPQTFEEIAAELGYYTLANAAEAEEGRELLRAFYKAVCRAPDLSGADAKRWPAKGWKLISRGMQGDMGDLWTQLADECFTASRRCGEVDWARLLGVEGPVHFESRAHGGSKVAVRFARYRTRLDYDVNGELKPESEVTT